MDISLNQLIHSTAYKILEVTETWRMVNIYNKLKLLAVLSDYSLYVNQSIEMQEKRSRTYVSDCLEDGNSFLWVRICSIFRQVCIWSENL